MVFADPPYDRGGERQWAARLLDTLAATGLLAPGGVFVMEQARDEAAWEDPRWTLVTTKAYGGTKVTYYQRATS
jgi:16S rRNA G966 N2-methylase RsmD